MPDAFIWYRTDEDKEPELLHWLAQVHQEADVEGKLFIRKESDQTTFMEAYTNVSTATINRIEKLADKQPLFKDIHRQCESFVEVTN